MSGILNNILEVFTSVGQWISSAFTNLMPVFYTAPTESVEGGLTIIGVLAVAGLAFSVAMLIFNLIRGFLRFE